MDFGKSAYLKTLEIERKLSSSKSQSSVLNGIYESRNIQNLEVSAGEYILDFGTLKSTNSASLCALIKGKLYSVEETTVGVSLVVNDEVIYDTNLTVKSNSESLVDIMKTYETENNSLLNIKIVLKSNHNFEILSMKMIVINATESNSSELVDDVELRALKTPDQKYIISYTEDTCVFAAHIDKDVSLELNFDCVMQGVRSHCFCFDKNFNLNLFYVTLDGKLYKRELGSVYNDELIASNVGVVYSILSPENVDADMIAAFTKNNGSEVYYLTIKNGKIGNPIKAGLPSKNYIDLCMASTSSFVFLVATSDSGDNYILKSAYEPLGGVVFDTLKASFILSTRIYNVLAEDTSENVETLIASINHSVETFKDYSSMIEKSGNTHLSASCSLNSELYSMGEKAIQYTVVIDKLNSDPYARVTYANDCASMEPMECVPNPTSGILNTIDTKNWENVWPFNAVKPCVLESGVFKGYVDPNNFKTYEDGSEVGSNSSTSYLDVMIEIPKIYYFIETLEDKIYVNISNQKIDDNYVCNAHVYDGVECDKIYIAAYHSVLKTYNGVQTWFSSTGSKVTAPSTWDPVDYDAPIKQKENGYRLLCFDQMLLLQCLFLLATKTTDSTNYFAKGRNGLTLSTNGSCDTKGMYSGSLASALSVKFMGIENIYGNVWTRVEGLAIRTSPDYDEYTICKRDPYSTVAFSRDGTGYDMERNPALDGVYVNRKTLVDPYGNTKYGFMPQALTLNGTEGTNKTYFADSVDIGPHYGMWWGGDYKRGADGGIFCTRLDINLQTSGYYNGFRLVYYPI